MNGADTVTRSEPPARITRVEDTTRRNHGLKEWRVYYTHGILATTLWVPRNLEPELFIDVMRDMDIQ